MKLMRTLLILAFAGLVWGQDQVPEPTQATYVAYRMFRTTNIYNFLLLDTRDGTIFQVQWSQKPEERGLTPINLDALADTKTVGRFTLYPTKNIYTFLLVDQEDGRVWQVQWGTTKDYRFITPISKLFDLDVDTVKTTPK